MQLPAFAAAPASVTFHRALVEEHRDEAAFLYGQRRALLAVDDAPWTRVAGVEQRLEAHLDALVVAGRRALAACLEHALAAEEPAHVFVAACLACRRRDADAIASLFDRLADADEEALEPLRAALAVELPADWLPLLVGRVAAARPAWVGLLADVARAGQAAVARVLLTALAHQIAVPRVAAALGRLRIDDARADLWRCLAEPDDGARAAALLALCRLGDREAPLHAVVLARQHPWARSVAAVCGDRSAVEALRDAAADAPDLSAIEALGVLGDPEAFDVLLAALAREDLAPAAARSLHWITGADLVDESFVPDPVDEAAMSASELEAWTTRQEAPTRIDGQPFGETVRTLSRDAARWRRHCEDHAAALRPGSRLRGGRACTPAVIVDSLAAPGADARLRRAAALELELRHGCDVPLDVGAPVAAQQAALARLRTWAPPQAQRTGPGAWTC